MTSLSWTLNNNINKKKSQQHVTPNGNPHTPTLMSQNSVALGYLRSLVQSVRYMDGPWSIIGVPEAFGAKEGTGKRGGGETLPGAVE